MFTLSVAPFSFSIVLDHQYRTRVVQEILETEEAYVAGLNLLVKFYKRPLEELIAKGAITQNQLRAVFSDIEVILGINEHVLSLLRPRVQAVCIEDGSRTRQFFFFVIVVVVPFSGLPLNVSVTFSNKSAAI
jgi:hypothetical protein